MKRSFFALGLALGAIAVSMPASADRFHHGWHGYYGDGWWWAIPPALYLATVPQVVYPDIPPVVIQQAPPPATVVVQPPVAGAPVAGSAPAQASPTWYYCTSAKTYYPYVNTCPEGWKAVPVTPPDVH